MGCEWSTPWLTRRRQYAAGQDAGTSTAAAQNDGSSSATHHGSVPPTREPPPNKRDPQDLTWQGLAGATRVKLPRSVAGQQFIIDSCQDCNLWLLDLCASVTVDDCTNCRVFVGPTEASVFLRGCSGCNVAAVTRQLRCRDCTDCALLLCLRTPPIIESCSGMAFGCFDAPYAGLATHMAAAQLSAFHNAWQEPYDFTPAGGVTAAGGGASGSSSSEHNWRLLPDSASVRQLLGTPKLPQVVRQLMVPAAAQAGSADAGACHGGEQPSGSGAAASSSGPDSTASDMAAAEPAPHQAAAALTRNDVHSVIVTHASRATDAVATTLFVMFPAGRRAAALAWVFEHLQQQQGEDEQPASEPAVLSDGSQQEEQDGQQNGQQQLLDAADVSIALQEGSGSASADGAVQEQPRPSRPEALLLHTNEAPVAAAVLKQLASAAGWSKQQVRQLGAKVPPAAAQKAAGAKLPACVGLQVACASSDAMLRLRAAAEAAGALACSGAPAAAAAKLFRQLGVDG